MKRERAEMIMMKCTLSSLKYMMAAEKIPQNRCKSPREHLYYNFLPSFTAKILVYVLFLLLA